MKATLTKNIIESMPYQKGGGTLLDMLSRVESRTDPEKPQKILDIASGKIPKHTAILAIKYDTSEFHHFKGGGGFKQKIFGEDNPENLKFVYSKDLEPIHSGDAEPYDMAIAFLTLHELRTPEESITLASQVLRPGGKMVVIEYDATWWNPLVSEHPEWDKNKEKKEFSKHVFTEGEEQKVLGYKNGIKIPRKLTMFKKVVEKYCIRDHTEKGLEDYSKILQEANIQPLEITKYLINTPWGERPKMCLYIGKKI